MQFTVLSGLSGAGKSTAMRALEDAGFFVTDNLPPELWVAMYDLSRASGAQRVAVVTDARTREFLPALEGSWQRLSRREGVRVVFLEATDEVLLRRYNLTRRAHPMGEHSLMADFDRERALLAPLRALADVVIDTTDLDARAFTDRLRGLFDLQSSFDLRLISFGFKHAPPRDADLVLDMRGLPNPHYDPVLRPKSGLDADVAAYVFNGPDSEAYYAHVQEFVRASADAARRGGRHSYSVAIGCTGGQHRSVAVAERLCRDLHDLGARVIAHRDVQRGEDDAAMPVAPREGV
ncbi:RNase adapter RapZ [Deinococcus maricopensis]|uniref:UPF0042 nucleotide-binding protein yhbJ n=1 Tax=Deinococcus maricopensis (strain DSM 21211 / LMG 22137 / NRRL B-23946 / LB-34) TaxID=709986 RepID=E8U9T3_DEIML|nr:RNase adapter RapZ [Deinococcus maricopensis]ADV67822.1 UPF0042 nucleotide-binding protein yhbJ [Deinococcus maricopensis DSM 21211]